MIQILASILILGIPQDHPGVDSAKVNAAIHKGIAYLKGAGSPPAYPADVAWHVPDSDELILLTFVHAGVSPRDPKFKEYFDKMMKARLDRTYKVVLQAMVLEELNRKVYQRRIMYCGNWLVNNQCENGQWGYGEPLPELEGVPTQSYRDPVASISRPGRDGKLKKPRVSKRLRVRQVRFAGASGDNSNSQYAALGIRACDDAGVIVPKETIARAREWWVKTGIVEGDKTAVATGGSGVPTGWGYRINQTVDPYASMTAGAVGAVVIYDHLLGKKWKKDKTALGGMAWLAKHFSVTRNGPGKPHFGGQPESMLYYYLYALERAGILSGTVDIGTHDWYREGANFILKSQKDDGSWKTAKGGGHAVWDTCFAILFLKRATRPLVASIDE